MPRIRRIDCSGPGITRRRRGKGFEYLDEEGRRVREDEVLVRIRELAIPPSSTSITGNGGGGETRRSSTT